MVRKLSFLIVAAIWLAACAPSPSATPPSLVEAPSAGQPQMLMETAVPAYPEKSLAYGEARVIGPTKSGVDLAASGASIERLVIKNADLTVVVPDPKASIAEISRMAETMGGYVVSSSLYQTYLQDGKPVLEGTIAIRVPADRLNEALETIKASAVEVRNENVTGQDVTAQYVDLESQLRNLEATEQQLMEIMKKAETTEDVLNVFNQLTAIRGQIESIKGQMKYYREAAALSSISVRLIAEESIQPIQIGRWKPQGTVRDAIQNLINFWQGFVDFLIWLVLNFLPKLLTIGLVLLLPLWLGIRALWRAYKKRRPPAT